MTGSRGAGPVDIPPGARGPVADILRAAQGTAGNQAIADLLAEIAPPPRSPDAPAPIDDARLPQSPDPDRPVPADPASASDGDAAAAISSPEGSSGTPGGPVVPPHEGLSLGDTAPARPPAGGGGGGGGGVVVAPASASPDAVMASATATASALPHPPAPSAPGAVPSPSRPPPSHAAAARRIPGPPPVPTVEPSYAHLPDPIAPATQRIEEIANRLLPEQTLPTVAASPGGHMPIVADADRPITDSDRRLILLGATAMDRAGLTHEGDPPGPGEQAGGENRGRLLALRDQLLAPPAATTDGAPPAPVTPPAITVNTPPMPAPDVTIAEQQLFTAVLARSAIDPNAAGERVIHDIKRDMRDYPGDALNNFQYPALVNLGHDQLPELTTRITDRVTATARIIGTAGAVLDQAVAARRAELAGATSATTDDTTTVTIRASTAVAATADTRLADAAAARTAAAEARRRAAVASHAPAPGFRQIAEGAVARIQAKVSEAIARFRLQKSERSRDLDSARDRLIAAYELAVAADEAAAQQANGVGPDQSPPTDPATLATARRRVSAAINRAREWKDGQVRTLRAAVERMKADANATCDANITAVEDEGATAFRDLRAWGATQDGAADDWWQGTATNLDRWANAAHDAATTWAETEARLARLQMQRDVARIRERLERAISDDADQAARYAHQTEDQKRDFVANYLMTNRRPNFLDQLSDDLAHREIATERAGIETAVESQLHALPRAEWEAIDFAAKAKDSSFSARARGDAIYSAGYDKIGTDEKTIYEQLEGLTPLQLEAVTKYYNNRRNSDTALYDDLDGEFSGDEWRRAQALMAGDPAAAAAEAIHDAVWGPGTNEAQIMAALRVINNLPEDQRAAARARVDSVYQERYGESLDSVLSGDLSGSELGQARALAAGNTTDAEAYETDYALSGGMSPDASATAAVYDRIRSESMQLARENNWTAAEFDAEVARRNAALDARFQDHFAGETAYSWGSGSALENAVGYRFALDRGNREMLQGYASGDMDAVDAGRMQAEREGTYADDEVMGGVVRAQFTRALDRAQLDRGPELTAGRDATLRQEVEARRRAGTPMTPEQEINRRMELQRGVDAALADHAFDLAHASSDLLNRRLVDRYGITLDDMLTQTMSDNVFGQGGALSDARGRLEIMRRDASDPGARRDRRLDWAYARARFGIEGVGTDMGELRGGMSGLTRDDMAEMDRRWRRDHDGESFVNAIHGDTSGRDEQDLVDLAKHGAPTTVGERIDELRRRLDRDEEGVGFAGDWASRDESRDSHASLARLEAMQRAMQDPNMPPDRRAQLSAAFDHRVENTRLAIEAQRAAVDSFADNFTTILQYVVGAIAMVVGIIAGIVTGGAAVPALIAIAGSVIGTLSGMAVKRAIRGSAYGAGDIATDLVVGAVDLIVTMATVGAFKGSSMWAQEGGRTLMEAARAGMRTAGRTTLRASLAQAARGTLLTAAERTVESGLRPSLTRRVLTFGGKFALDQAEQLAWSLPTVIASNMMNEENWRHGNLAGNLARGTWEGAVDNLRNGVVMGLAGAAMHGAAGRYIHAERSPAPPIEARAREYLMFQTEHPGASRADYVAHMEAEAAATSAHAEAVRVATSEARRELLSELPPAERHAIADVPILHVSEGDFRTLNGGNYGDAMVFVRDGQAVIVVREGAPAAAVRGMAAEVREIVAPGTAGRTVNPADSLPPRLRNRVGVEVVRAPGFGLDEVRAVPQRDHEGNITGVTLQIGPNARAADIQNHVATIEAMRRYAGLAGEARLMLHDLARAAGMDLVSPRERGRWEASLEVAKLPGIIEDRMTRLSEHGLDPRRRALIEHEIANLREQLASERARLAEGAGAAERGYVAAQPTKTSAAPMDAATLERTRARGREILNELGAVEPGLKQLEARFNRMEQAPEQAMQAIDQRLGELTARAESSLVPPPRALIEIREMIAERRFTEASTKLAEWLQGRPSIEAVPREELARMRPHDRAPLERLDQLRALRASFDENHARFVTERDAMLEQIEPVRRQVDLLQSELNSLRMFNGIALHPDLPNPVAGLNYTPDARTIEAMQAHLNGYLAEVRLANRIATERTGIVIDYGHAVGVNYADVISVDPHTGRVTLWDSKFRSAGRASMHSETFTDPTRLTSARDHALRLLQGSSHGLSPEIRQNAIESLRNWDFDATTSHTNGGKFRDETLVIARDPNSPPGASANP